MKYLLKYLLVFLLITISVTTWAWFIFYNKTTVTNSKYPGAENLTIRNRNLQRLKVKALAIKEFVQLNNYNTTYCFMADMRIGSGEKRFFVYNLVGDSVELAGLVAHGSGRNISSGKVAFSNAPNSLCTSLGKYKIGNSYNGTFGLAYKLYGLDKTNSNAFSRFVVLHSHPCVPQKETGTTPICESWGCPTVAPAFLGQLNKYIQSSPKPVLLDVYY